MDKLLTKLENYILYFIVFLFPIAVFSISPNPYVVSKLVILFYGLVLLLIVKSIKVITVGKLDWNIANFDFPVLLLGAAYLISLILRTQNKMEAFLLPGTATFILGGVFLYFLVNQLKNSQKEVLSQLLFLSSGVFSLLILLSFSGLFAKIPQLPPFFKSAGFTPDGGFLPASIFLLSLMPVGLASFMSEKDITRKIFLGAGGVVVVLALAISLYNILPGRDFTPRFPSYGVSWSVAVDSLKGSPLLGIGPGNYLTAFNRFRPIEYNSTELWALKYSTARSFFLSSMTETGMLGLAALILILFAVYKAAKSDFKEKKMVNWGFSASASLVSLVIVILALLFFPATALIFVTFMILLALNTSTRKTTLKLTTEEVGSASTLSTQSVSSRFPAFLLTIPVVAGVIFLAFRGSKILVAEYKFNKALNLLTQNKATQTYDTMREAINTNPQVDRYHATFARINLALANSIVQRAVSQEGTGAQQLSDNDRQTITTLVQQAINEGKATVALNPLRAGNWEILAQVYRSVMPLAQGADTFTIQSYRQAVALDPLNPNLRIALGGVYYALGNFDQASQVFELAASAKPDLANAHYNLSLALKESDQLDRAIAEMSLVLSLITDKASQDYVVARKALEDMQAEKQAQVPVEAGTGEELTPPQPAEDSLIEPPLDLPEGSEPPEAPISPTPTGNPSATTTVTPQVTPTVTPLP